MSAFCPSLYLAFVVNTTKFDEANCSFFCLEGYRCRKGKILCCELSTQGWNRWWVLWSHIQTCTFQCVTYFLKVSHYHWISKMWSCLWMCRRSWPKWWRCTSPVLWCFSVVLILCLETDWAASTSPLKVQHDSLAISEIGHSVDG